ncbi:MAG TPA: adenylate/guanylate cyclase domain-containing protein [Burkholderiales bacterium]|nr:adenylate/guanylate cyclase domain-containing protein [Burkholderiales bacterium]
MAAVPMHDKTTVRMNQKTTVPADQKTTVRLNQKTAVPAQQKTALGFAPGTERRQATLLCIELRGLARLSEALDPGLVIVLANEFFNFAADAVAAHGGEAVDAQHELLLSLFTRGNPSQTSQQAVRAAQRVQSGFPAIAEKWRVAYGLRAAVAQGLHLGEAVLGVAGPRGLERRTALGDSVALALCMVHRARAGEFVMSDSVMGALSVENLDLDAEPLPQLELPRRTPIRIYGVLVEGRLDFT